MTMMFHGLLGIFQLLVSVTGAIVAGLAVGRSRWAVALAAGFAGEATVTLFSSLVPALLQRSGLGMSQLQTVFLISSALGLVARATVVAGAAGVLSELRPRPTPPPLP